MISGGITATGVIDGENGDNGYSSAVVQLYRRYAPTQVAPTPALPTGALIYTFATGVLSGATASFNGWSQQIPAASAGTKLFVTQATAISQDATDEISVNDWSTPVEYTKDGESALVADLTNGMDSVAMASDGKVLAQTVLTTTFNMYYGTALQTLTSLSPSGAAQGVTVSCNKLTGVVTITIAANTQLTDDKNVITLTGVCGQGTRSCEFTVSGIRGGSAGVTPTLFNIVPSVDTIKRDKNNTLTPESITCSVQKITGNNVTTAAAGDGTLRYAVDGDITSSSDGTAMSLGDTVSYTANNHYITFAYFVGTTMRDKERVPIVYDGEKGDTGDGAAEVYVSPGSITVPCTNAGAVASQITQGLTFSMRVGTHAVDANNIKSITAGTCPTGVSVQAVYVNVRTVTITTSATASGMAAGIEFTVVGTYDGKDYTAKCTLALIGSKQGAGGPKGDTGPMFYLCGEWANGTEYERTKQRCPVVYYGGKYWYLENEGTSTGDTPGPSSSVWEEAENFNMVFTDVLFAKDFAMLGSFIVSGDWLMSTKGILGSAESQDYTKFDPAYPDTSVNTTHTVNGTTWTGYNFVPNFAVDGLTGRSYMNNADIKGTVRATNFFHNVVVHGDEYVYYCQDDNVSPQDGHTYPYVKGRYYLSSELDSYWGTTNLQICTYEADIVVVPHGSSDTGGVSIDLPMATDFDGKLVEIVDTRYTQSNASPVGGLTVYQCDGASKMRGTFGATPAQYVRLNTNNSHDGGNYRLLSYEGYWVRLSTIGNV